MPEKGIVLEVHRNRAVIMTEQCEFKELKLNRHLNPGEEIYFTKGEIITEKSYSLIKIGLVASLLIFFIFAFYASRYSLFPTAYAYVGLDVNPSIEMAIDEDYRVINVTGFNSGAYEVIEGCNLVGKNLDESIQLILENYIQRKVLEENQNNHIAVSSHLTGMDDNETLLKYIDKVITTELTRQNIRANLYCFNIDKKIRLQAINQNVSPIRYLLWLKARERETSLSLNQISLKDPEINKVASKLQYKIKKQKAKVPEIELPITEKETLPNENSEPKGQRESYINPVPKGNNSGEDYAQPKEENTVINKTPQKGVLEGSDSDNRGVNNTDSKGNSPLENNEPIYDQGKKPINDSENYKSTDGKGNSSSKGGNSNKR